MPQRDAPRDPARGCELEDEAGHLVVLPRRWVVPEYKAQREPLGAAVLEIELEPIEAAPVLARAPPRHGERQTVPRPTSEVRFDAHRGALLLNPTARIAVLLE